MRYNANNVEFGDYIRLTDSDEWLKVIDKSNDGIWTVNEFGTFGDADFAEIAELLTESEMADQHYNF